MRTTKERRRDSSGHFVKECRWHSMGQSKCSNPAKFKVWEYDGSWWGIVVCGVHRRSAEATYRRSAEWKHRKFGDYNRQPHTEALEVQR